MALHLVRDEDDEPVIDLESALIAYEQIDERIKELEKHRSNYKAQIVGGMAFQERKRVEVASHQPGKKYRATVSTPTRTTVDGEGLAKEIGARRFARVSRRVLDNEKFLQAINDGKIDQTVAAKYINQTKGNPSVRFYLVDEKEEADEADAED